jgi:hypothetical protein
MNAKALDERYIHMRLTYELEDHRCIDLCDDHESCRISLRNRTRRDDVPISTSLQRCIDVVVQRLSRRNRTLSSRDSTIIPCGAIEELTMGVKSSSFPCT